MDIEKSRDELVAEYSNLHDYSVLMGGLIGGMSGLLVIAFCLFVAWCLFPTQVKLYPDYVTASLSSTVQDTFSGLTKGYSVSASGVQYSKYQPSIPSEPTIRYLMFRRGNLDHRLDPYLVHYGKYPAGVRNPTAWVHSKMAMPPIYRYGPATYIVSGVVVFFACIVVGLVLGFRRRDKTRNEMLVGKRVSGTCIVTPETYNEKTKGDGMVYLVRHRGSIHD